MVDNTWKMKMSDTAGQDNQVRDEKLHVSTGLCFLGVGVGVLCVDVCVGMGEGVSGHTLSLILVH